jgi:hypothetical protein
MTIKHTAGPWAVARLIPQSNEYIRTIKAGDEHIAHVGDFINGMDEARANARLIAAAPELLKAAQLLIKLAGMDGRIYELDEEGIAAAEAAIIKATGEQP